MAGVAKRLEGIWPGWHKDGRGYGRGGKYDGMGFVREGICLYTIYVALKLIIQ